MVTRGFGTLDSRPWTLDFAICPCLPHPTCQEDEPLSQESENSYRRNSGCGGLGGDRKLKVVESEDLLGLDPVLLKKLIFKPYWTWLGRIGSQAVGLVDEVAQRAPQGQGFRGLCQRGGNATFSWTLSRPVAGKLCSSPKNSLASALIVWKMSSMDVNEP